MTDYLIHFRDVGTLKNFGSNQVLTKFSLYLSMEILGNPELNDFNNHVPTKILNIPAALSMIFDLGVHDTC